MNRNETPSDCSTSSLTIQGIDDRLYEKIQTTAKHYSLSTNQFLLESLRKMVKLEKNITHAKVHHDLDFLFGSWSEEEFIEFQNSQQGFELIGKGIEC